MTATTPTLGKDRPIIFSAPMVRALLDGRKTQTRRLLKPDLAKHFEEVVGEAILRRHPNQKGLGWEVGDRLWVREAWTHDADSIEALRAAVEDVYCDGSYGPYYRATEPAPETMRWRSPIFMPRWASRLTLTVTNVRLERLGDISEADAAAEGFRAGPMGDPMPETDIGGGWTVSSPGGWASAAGHFQILWTELHPEWDGYSSPWVAVITFTVHHANIDALQPAPVGAGRS